MTDLKKAYPYGWTRKPTYEELDKIFERCRELHQEAEMKLEAVKTLAKGYWNEEGDWVTHEWQEWHDKLMKILGEES